MELNFLEEERMKATKKISSNLKVLKDKFSKSRGKGNIQTDTQVFNHPRGNQVGRDGKN